MLNRKKKSLLSASIAGVFTMISLLQGYTFSKLYASAYDKDNLQSQLIQRLYNGGGGRVSCDFDGYVNTPGRHEGIDFAKGSGSPVYSLIDGIVINVVNTNSSSSLSTLSIYDSKNDKTVIYLHTANICVEKGSTISIGQQVATESDHGAGGSPHTHVEVRNGQRELAAKSVNDPTLDNDNPYPYWDVIFNSNSNRIDTPVDTSYNTNVSCTAPSKIYTYDMYGNLEGNRWVDKDDPCIAIEAYATGFWKIDYPSGSTRRQAYMKLSEWNPFSKLGHNPVGYLDGAAGGNGTVTVSGWAYDADTPNEAVEIHIYMDGEAGVGTCVATGIIADKERPDVNNAGYPGNHGFEATINISATGIHTFYAHAINRGEAGEGFPNTLLTNTHETNIKPIDAKITKVSVSHMTQDSFRAEIDVTNSNGLTAVKVPSWSNKDWMDDVVWHPANKYTETHWYADIKASEHNNVYGNYSVDIYLYNGDTVVDSWHGENEKRTTVSFGNFKLKYDANGGSISSASKDVVFKEKYGTLPTPSKTGYKFDGWYTAANGGTKVDANTVHNVFQDTTIYAHWTQTEYIVTFDPSTGSVSPQTLKVKMDSVYGTLPIPTKEGANFKGWYTAKAGGTKIEASTKFTAAANQTLYAQWEDYSLTIYYNTNGGTLTTNDDYLANESGAIFTLKDQKPVSVVWKYAQGDKQYGLFNATTFHLTKQGYAFYGWSTSKDGDVIFDQDDTTVTSNDLFPSITSKNGEVTLYARWKAVENPFKGSGTKDDPYRITNKEDLVKMQELVNDKVMTSVFGNAYYRQPSDINLDGEKWIPIGKNFKDGVQGVLPNFKGFYDGHYHSIKGLYVSETDKFAGLFGHVGGNGIIENLEVYGTVSSEGASVGGIAGEICDATIRNCAFYGDVHTSGNAAGGILGYLWQCGTVENCYHNGTVANTGEDRAGGVVGTIQTGDDHDENAYVKNCYHVGAIEGLSEKCGAIVGFVTENTEKNGRTHIINCYGLKSDSVTAYNGKATKDEISLLTENQLRASAEDLGRSYVMNPNEKYPVLRVVGDANSDRVLSVADVILLQRWLLTDSNAHIADWISVDIYEDGKLNIFDLCLLKRKLLNN